MLRGIERPPGWAVVTFIVALVALIVMVPFAYRRGGEPLTQAELARMDAAAASASAADAATAADGQPLDVPAAMALLEQADRPWTMAVIGDSTGNEPDEWVALLATRMSSMYDRPVAMNYWSIDSASYSPAVTIGSGGNAPIVIWNGSASGKSAGYSLQNLDALTPEQPDLVIFSHGHNEGAGDIAVDELRKLVAAVTSKWTPRPGYAVVLQNPREDARAAGHADVVASIRQAFSGASVVSVIDVWSAFTAAPDLSNLLNSGRYHPNDAGEELWTDVTARALGVS